jgi:hypothetical protein
MASIVSMMIVRLVIVAIVLVALMIAGLVTTAMLTVARFMATRSRNMSRFLFLWLLLTFGNLIKNASRLISCLTLLEEGNHSEWVGTSERQNLDLEKLILTADQINLNLLQCIT